MALPLDVRHHQQDNSTSCGCACAQMVIGFEFARLAVMSGTALPDQATMQKAETGTLKDWATEPAELAWHINQGLLANPGAKTWAVVECKPTAGSSMDPAVEVATTLFNTIVKKLDAGFPSVVMLDDNDHWETAFNYTIRPDGTDLYTIDPLPALVQPVPTHSDTDTCFRHENTVWFWDTTSAHALVCNTPTFVDSAIAIVQTDPTDWWWPVPAAPRNLRVLSSVPSSPAPDPRFIDAWKRGEAVVSELHIHNPLPPLDKHLPLIALMNFFKRDMWRMTAAMARLPEAASYSDFDWSHVVVRHAAFFNNPERKIAIVAAPPRQGKARSILLSIDQRGAVDVMHLTSSVKKVESLATDGDEPLWIVPKFSRWLPFIKAGGDGPATRFRRLYDGFEIDMTNRDHENR